MAAVGARRPRATLAELGQRGDLDAWPEAIADGDGFDAIGSFLVEVMRHVAEHARRVAVVVVVERVPGVAHAWLGRLEVLEAGCPQDLLANRLPLARKLSSQGRSTFPCR